MESKQSNFVPTIETEKIISCLKNNESPTPDNIVPTVIKAIAQLVAA